MFIKVLNTTTYFQITNRKVKYVKVLYLFVFYKKYKTFVWIVSNGILDQDYYGRNIREEIPTSEE